MGYNVLSVSTSDLILDHFSIVADLRIPPNHSWTVPQTIQYWKLQAINLEAFKADIKRSELIRHRKTNATGLAQQYDSVLRTLIDLHSPLVTKKISPKYPNPPILASKVHCRYLDHIWRRNQTAVNRSRLSRQTHHCNRQWKAKLAHYSKIIAEHSGDHRSLWKPSNKIVHRCPKMHIPDHSSIVDLVHTFSSFFINKISVIRSFFPSDSLTCVKSSWHQEGLTEPTLCHRWWDAPSCSAGSKQVIGLTPSTNIIKFSLIERSFLSNFMSALVSPPIEVTHPH